MSALYPCWGLMDSYSGPVAAFFGDNALFMCLQEEGFALGFMLYQSDADLAGESSTLTALSTEARFYSCIEAEIDQGRSSLAYSS